MVEYLVKPPPPFLKTRLVLRIQFKKSLLNDRFKKILLSNSKSKEYCKPFISVQDIFQCSQKPRRRKYFSNVFGILFSLKIYILIAKVVTVNRCNIM